MGARAMTTPTTARKSCRACGHETSRPVDACPNCGDVYQTTTTTAQPTPAPWTVEKHAGNQYKIGASVGYVAIVAPRPDTQHRVGWESAVESANARLIAAAPALLAALEQIAARLPSDCGSQRIARAAIRQARG